MRQAASPVSYLVGTPRVIIRGKDTLVKKENSARAFQRSALTGVALLFILGDAAIAPNTPEVPVIDGGLGSCSANFTVTDNEKKPIYNAKIDVVLRYGFIGLRKSELQVGTNSDGKARVTGLPEKAKKPLEFRITSGPLSKTILHNPSAKCDANFEVVLGTK